MPESPIQIGDVVRDRRDREGVVCSRESRPSAKWINELLDSERVRHLIATMGASLTWWGVMPFGGGYLLLPEPDLVRLRKISFDDFMKLVDTASEHGRKQLIELFPEFVEFIRNTDRLEVQFRTDAATMVIFDPEAVVHRRNERPDWWSDPIDELQELNAGNAVFVGLNSDGLYSATQECVCSRVDHVQALVKSPSGVIFIGAGEQMVGGGFGPRIDTSGGTFVSVGAATYRVGVARTSSWSLAFCIHRQSGPATNAFAEPLSLDDI